MFSLHIPMTWSSSLHATQMFLFLQHLHCLFLFWCFFYFCFPVLVFQYLLNNQLHTFCLLKHIVVSNILYMVYKNNEVFPRRMVVINSAYITVEYVIPKQNISSHCAWRQFLFASAKSIVYGNKFLNRSLRYILIL